VWRRHCAAPGENLLLSAMVVMTARHLGGVAPSPRGAQLVGWSPVRGAPSQPRFEKVGMNR
jgi:hypothetical protein